MTKEWISLALLSSSTNKTFLEPFAGSNNIVRMIEHLGYDNKWHSYDIEPQHHDIIQQDTILNYPGGYDICITNPPYLAKNSATRKKYDTNLYGDYENLYQVCLEKMLKSTNYVAAIIPETFITSGLFQERLYAFISLTTNNIFSDTEIPVCLALWIDKHTGDFKIYNNNLYIGSYNEISENKLPSEKRKIFKFNDKNGQIGIKFIDGNKIKSDDIKISSRMYTRVKIDDLLLCDDDYANIIQEANNILDVYRKKSFDLFLTAFK